MNFDIFQDGWDDYVPQECSLDFMTKKKKEDSYRNHALSVILSSKHIYTCLRQVVDIMLHLVLKPPGP